MLIRILALLLVPSLALAQATGPAFDACQPPGQWPLGTAEVDFFYEHQDVRDTPIKTSGWDPAHDGIDLPVHQTNKDILTASVQTYAVGALDESAMIPWPYSFDLDNSVLSAADSGDDRISQISLTGIGTVYLVQDYDFSNSTIWTQPGLTVAFHNVRTNDIRTASGGHDKVLMVDSLTDIVESSYTARGPFRGGEQNDDCDTVVMYSEVAGGRDAGKNHNTTFYRSHLHGMLRPRTVCEGGTQDGQQCSDTDNDFSCENGGGAPCNDRVHTDGVQINASSACAQVIESNVELVFRTTNWPVFWQNSNPSGLDNNWIVNNLISGGQGSVDVCGKDKKKPDRFGPCGDFAVCGNATLATNGNVSWASPSSDTSQNVTSFFSGVIEDIPGETNVRYVGPGNGFWGPQGFSTTVTDNEGDSHSWGNGGSNADGQVPATGPHSQAAIEARVAQMDVWVAEIRAAAGASGSSGPIGSLSCSAGPVGSGTANCVATVSGGTTPYSYSKDCAGGTNWVPASDTFSCTGLALGASHTIAVRVQDSASGELVASDTITVEDYLVSISVSDTNVEETADSVQLNYSTNWTPSSCTFDLDGDGGYDDTCSPGSGTCDLPDGTFTAGTYTLGVNCDGNVGTATLTTTAVDVGPSVERVVRYGSTSADELGDPIPEILSDPFTSGETISLENLAALDYFGADVYLTGGVQPTASECVDWTLTTQDGTLNNVQGSVPHCFYLCQGQDGQIPAGYFNTAGAASLAVTVYDGPKVAGSCTGNAGPTTTINFTLQADNPSPSTTTILRGVTLTGASVQ